MVVVENASGEAETLRSLIHERGWGDVRGREGEQGWCELMELAENRGFAAGNNAAIEPALASEDPPDYVWLLNPDTVVRPGALRALLTFMQEHPEVGIAGSRLEEPDGAVQRSAFRFPSVAGEFEGAVKTGPVTRLLRRWVVAPEPPGEAQRCDWVAGASMLIRRAVFDRVGLMDEGYFMYYEEVDFCRRAADAGWSCWYVPASRVVHLVGRSSGVTSDRPRRRPQYWYESRGRYFDKNHGRWKRLLADVAFAAGLAGWRLRRALTRKPDPDPPHLLSDFLRYSVSGALSES